MALTASERKDIADGSLVAARELALSAQEAEQADLESMTLEELVQLIDDIGGTVDLDAIEAEARAAIGTDASLLNRGSSLSEEKRADLEARMQKAVVRIARTVTRDVIRQARAAAIQEGDEIGRAHV